MADLFKVLGQGTLATGGPATLYTVPTGWQAAVKNIVLVNYSGTDRTFDIFVNGSADVNRLCKAEPLQASKRVILPEVELLEDGDTILGSASANTAIVYTIFGVENQ